MTELGIFERHPNEERLADDMVFGYEAPNSGVFGVVSVVAHHEVVVHFELVGVSFGVVDEYFVTSYVEFVVFIDADDASVEAMFWGVRVTVVPLRGMASGPKKSRVQWKLEGSCGNTLSGIA
jgi:hypothetical protein